MRTHFAILGIAALSSIAVAQDRPPLERYVPNDAVMVFSFRDLPGVWQRMQGLSFVKALKDPALKPFVDAVKKELTSSMEAAASSGGIDFDRLAEVVRGQTLIAVRMPANAEGKPTTEVQVLADVEGREEAVRVILDRAVNKAVQEGKASKRVAGEVTILTLSKGGDAEKNRFCYALKGGLLVGADKPEVCAKTVQSLPGGPTTPLLQNQTLTKFRRSFAKQANGLGDVEAYILNAKAITDAAKKEIDGPPPTAASQSVEAMGVSVCAARGDYETLTQFMIVPKSDLNFAKENTMPGRTLPTDAWTPDHASFYLSFNLDLDRLYEQIVKQIETLIPGGVQRAEEQLREFPDRANPLITSIKKDVIDPLGDRVTLVVDRGDYNGRNQLRALLAWKLRDSDRMTRLISGACAQAGPVVTEKAVKGFNVYVFPPIPQPPAAPNPSRKGSGRAPEPFIWFGNPALAVTKSHLLAATHVELVDRTLNFQGQPGLAEHAPAGRVLTKVPELPSAVFYLKPEEFGRALYNVLSDEAMQKQLMSIAADLPKVGAPVPKLSEAIKEGKLPPFDEVRKYFTAPAGGFVSVEDGALRMSIYSLR